MTEKGYCGKLQVEIGGICDFTMRLKRQSTRQPVTLDPASPLGVGGEACIYEVPQDLSLVAKVYHKPADERARKLAAMLDAPPDDPMAAQGHVSIAWPVDLLCSEDGKIVGFLMPMVAGIGSIFDFYNPGARRKRCPLFDYRYLHRTARNLAAAVRALHQRGYVIGDVNESNILTSDTALVTLVDTDSFQVSDPHSGVVYRCTVGKPEFTPPELQGKSFADIDRAPEHDLFGLAVLIFQLLMEGTHPFAGIFQGEGEPPSYQERISAGHFPYSRGRRVPYRPALTSPPFKILHPALRDLFVRCFKNGRRKPRIRPDAHAWQSALDDAENALVTCSDNDQHCYSDHLKVCPWCERAEQLGGRDPFPSLESVRSGQHLQPVHPVQTPLPSAGRKTIISPTPTTTPTAPAQPVPVGRSAWTWIASVLALLAAFTLLGGFLLPWWLLLTCEAILGPATLVCGVINWRRTKALVGRDKWVAGAALGVGTAVVIISLLLVASAIANGRLPWRLSLIFVVVLGAAALICGVVGWRWIRMLAARGRWIAGAALGIGMLAALVSLLALLEVFMLAGDRLYLTTLACAVVLSPAALVCGTVGWERVKTLAEQHDLWIVGASSGLLPIFMIVCGQLRVAALVYAVMASVTAALACASRWQWVKLLAGHGRWVTGVALGMSIVVVALVLLFVALLIAEESLPWWLLLVFEALLGPAALACGSVGWRRVKVLAGSGKWATSIAWGMGTAATLVLLLGLLAGLILVGGRLNRTALACAVVLGPAALACGVISWRRAKALTRYSRWLVGAALGTGTAVTLVLLFSILSALVL